MGKEEWITYNERRPEEAGTYEWLMPSRACKGLMVSIFAEMRERGAGYQNVLSPCFDYWDGYRVHVPEGLMWRAAVDIPKLSSVGRSEVKPVGVKLSTCPFCKMEPEWRSSHRNSRGGLIVLGSPQDMNSWHTECCSWAGRVYFDDPRKLAEERASLLSA